MDDRWPYYRGSKKNPTEQEDVSVRAHKALADLNWGAAEWVMFMDNSDLWHKVRAEAYATMLQEMGSEGRCTWCLRP